MSRRAGWRAVARSKGQGIMDAAQFAGAVEDTEEAIAACEEASIWAAELLREVQRAAAAGLAGAAAYAEAIGRAHRALAAVEARALHADDDNALDALIPNWPVALFGVARAAGASVREHPG